MVTVTTGFVSLHPVLTVLCEFLCWFVLKTGGQYKLIACTVDSVKRPTRS